MVNEVLIVYPFYLDCFEGLSATALSQQFPFLLILCMLVLHEMDDEVRSSVLSEMKRIIKADGRVLLIDFHADRPSQLKGWLSKLMIVFIEVAAGRRHFRNYRHFMSIGGLSTLIDRSQFLIDKERIVGNKTIAIYLLRLK